MNTNNLALESYLSKTRVYDCLGKGFKKLLFAKPNNSIEYLAKYLQKHAFEYDSLYNKDLGK